MIDTRFGIVGESEPLVCACGCGQAVRGRHANTYAVTGTNAVYYILAKHVEAWDADPSQHASLVNAFKGSKKIVFPGDDKKESK